MVKLVYVVYNHYYEVLEEAFDSEAKANAYIEEYNLDSCEVIKLEVY